MFAGEAAFFFNYIIRVLQKTTKYCLQNNINISLLDVNLLQLITLKKDKQKNNK